MVDLVIIKNYVYNGFPHPCNSCTLCMPSGYKTEESKLICKKNLEDYNKTENLVIAYIYSK